MARISTYPVQPNPDGSDILLGTDATGGTNATSNFRIRDVASAAIAFYLANTNWKFETDIAVAPFEKSTVYFPSGEGDNTSWSNITSLRFQTIMRNDTVSQPYLEYLLSNDPVTGQPSKNNIIQIMDRNDLGSFGVYKFLSLTHIGGSIYEAELSYVQGNGVIEHAHTYGFEADPVLGGGGGGTFVHNQNIALTTWDIFHDLEKYPSVTMVLSTGQVGMGDVVYIDNNNLTITFAGAESGKAYLN